MEKISLYNLLSILLPGAVLTFIGLIIIKDYELEFISLADSEFFSLTIYLSSSVFLGSVINILTKGLLKVYSFVGLYTSVITIYNSSKNLNYIKPFFNKKFNNSKGQFSSETLEEIWSKIYYKLEVNENISIPKEFQSFYYFFRNFFTLGLILLIPLIALVIMNWYSQLYSSLLISNVLCMILSIFAGKWYRIKMVERMFWTHYSLKNKKISNHGKSKL